MHDSLLLWNHTVPQVNNSFRGSLPPPAKIAFPPGFLISFEGEKRGASVIAEWLRSLCESSPGIQWSSPEPMSDTETHARTPGSTNRPKDILADKTSPIFMEPCHRNGDSQRVAPAGLRIIAAGRADTGNCMKSAISASTWKQAKGSWTLHRSPSACTGKAGVILLICAEGSPPPHGEFKFLWSW